MQTTSTAAGGFVTAAGAVVLEITGVEMPPLVWALIGAALAQGYAQVPVNRWRSLVQVISSGFIGSLLGLSCAHLGGVTHNHFVLLLCAIGGVGAHPIMQALVQRAVARIRGQNAF